MGDERKRRYYSISDVAKMMDLKAHVLRYWESEFSVLRPRKNRAGNRAYTERDIKIVRLIKSLLHEEGFTVEGARKRLKANRELIDNQLAQPLEPTAEIPEKATDVNEEIEAIKSELNELKDIVRNL